jgi:hypothetical protein
MSVQRIHKLEVKKLEELIEEVRKNNYIRNPKYICEEIEAEFGNPYNYLCWNCARIKMNGTMRRCSWARFGSKVGQPVKDKRTGYSPIFGMTGLEILEEQLKELKQMGA